MAYSITVSGETIAELKNSLSAALAALGASEALAKASPTKKAAAPADDDGPAEPEQPKKAAAKKTEPPPAEDDDAAFYAEHVRPLIVKLSKDHGRDAAVEVCGQFEDAAGNACTKGQEVQPDDYEALIKAVKKAQKRLDAEKAAAEDE